MPMRPAPAPCATCPWRYTTDTHRIPGGGMDADACRRALEGVSSIQGVVMQCHREDVGHVCAGFLLSEDADHHLSLRLAYATGVLEPGPCDDGGADLYPTIRDMMAAHGVER